MGTSAKELELLYRNRFGAFRNGLAPICGGFERAHDAVQEAFARALREQDRFRGEGSLEGWVWRIAFRVALDEHRNGHEVMLDEAFERAAVPQPERDRDLAEALRRLPPRRKLIVFLRHFADLSYTEIAELCEISEGTVAATLARAHVELAETLSREGMER
ncbi:MAG TPA: sigma-70 family RNA polymerase sigma factor [Gaiellaceae bacterium]